MTDAELYNLWFLYLGVAAVVVIVAAALLLAVLAAARSIEKGATAALGMVEQIQDTNEVAAQLREGAAAILSNATAIAEALHDGELRRGEN